MKFLEFRELWWDWNPKRLRRLLKQAKLATDNNAYGWSNTHKELLELKCQLEVAEYYIEACDNIIVQYMPDWKDGQ